MHLSISFFPNRRFYQNQILDAENVLCESYKKRYLPGRMFGSYSFINIGGGREEKDDDGQSIRNMVEVAIVIKIVKNLYKAWKDSTERLTIGVVSPYAAQVVAIQEKLPHKYEKLDGFSVKVKSIDGFQAGEEDVIILSTVRSNSRGSVGFMSSVERTNVALTRARHCLWILGDVNTLTASQSVWKELVVDARESHCLFEADSDECLNMTPTNEKKELEQLVNLVNKKSILFKHAKWKVLFSDNFRRSFRKLTAHLKKLVLNLLLRLSSGWRPKSQSVDLHCEKSSHILKKFKVGSLYIICTNDIIKEFNYVQVLKVWDVLPTEEIPKLTKRLESIFTAYTDDYIKCCTERCVEGKLVVPKSWMASQEIIRFCPVSNTDLSSGDGKSYAESSKVNESLLLMKFYPLSDEVGKHLLSYKEQGQIPMQLSDEQMEIVLYPNSTFIIGRSGTGKTTILTMKLFQNECSFYVASEGIYEGERNSSSDSKVDGFKDKKPSVLRQLFVSVSPNLCHAVKQHVSHLTSISLNGNTSLEVNLDDPDMTSKFSDIADTFIDIPVKNYPLFITFHKFLMMLDGTLGNSFFLRFLKAREVTSPRSVALQTFLRLKEVTYDRFCNLYCPRFNSSLTKKLEPSRVFTEIISHIKGGLHAGECSARKLSHKVYCSLAESRSSTLTIQKRESIYHLFQAYEEMKSARGEYDLGDLVSDLHHRLKNRRYEGDIIDFVYIDEVQDLSMRQISLFKYICQNVKDGFIFAGDTAQTIARGIDFRFQDIRSMFYKEFLSVRITGKQEKALVSEVFQLKQNFRTHVGVLNLAQSVIDILYYYFVYSIDVLEPETSLIHGENPVLLESKHDESAIVKIFGGNKSREIVGFGAEQVILVRDDREKIEVCKHVGKHALVLTIIECKGLEFQDVLLYNFFGTSPLKDQWRVIYGYMKYHDCLDKKLPQSFPTFSEARHSVLCSELKQLYVAITRTRQRLWICENKEEFSKPMFDYWKRKGLVQIRKLDSSVAQAMQVSSIPQEWGERGEKLLRENNFAMATMCFEKAGMTEREKLSKASGLRAFADQMRVTNPQAYEGYLKKAAGLFESIGKLDSAASCYCDLGEYERAGKIYLHKCGKIDAAAECFTLAGCYSDAAEAYAKGNQFSNCLSACKKGKLFDKGMQYIGYWKEHVNGKSKEPEQIEQEYLSFLSSLGCLDDLLMLKESGLLLEAAELARSRGDVIKEADLLENAGRFQEATVLLLWYMFFGSLWGEGNPGWPLMQFSQKEELCRKAKSLAKMCSDSLYDFACNEIEVLSDQCSNLTETHKHLHNSQKNNSLRGEILAIRKIVDSHLHLDSSSFVWEDELPIDIDEHCDKKISENRVSVRTLVFYWNKWKRIVLNIFLSLEWLENVGYKGLENEHKGLIEFSLNYFGVRKQYVKGQMAYIVVSKDALWVRDNGKKCLHHEGKRLTIDTGQLVYVVRSYWLSELVSVGIKVLETLDALRKSSLTSSAFHQSTCLLHMHEVSSDLYWCRHLDGLPCQKEFRIFLEISTDYFNLVFPLDWRKSVSKELISLRETDLSFYLLQDAILVSVIKGGITYWAIGRVMMIYLIYGKQKNFDCMVTLLKSKRRGRSFLNKYFCGNLEYADVARNLLKVLEDNVTREWRYPGCISIHSIVYLLDSLFVHTLICFGLFFMTRSSLVGWLSQFSSSDTPFTHLRLPSPDCLERVQEILLTAHRLLLNKDSALSWIENSKINSDYYPMFALKLVMLTILFDLNFSSLLKNDDVVHLLPPKFVAILLKDWEEGDWKSADVVGEAFISIEDPLVIVNSSDEIPAIIEPCAIVVDLRKSKEEIINILFAKKTMPCDQLQNSSTVPLGRSVGSINVYLSSISVF